MNYVPLQYFMKPCDIIVLVLKRELEVDGATGSSKEQLNGEVNNDNIAQKLEAIYKRLEFIDAYSAVSRAASILAVSSQTCPLVVSSYFKMHIQ